MPSITENTPENIVNELDHNGLVDALLAHKLCEAGKGQASNWVKRDKEGAKKAILESIERRFAEEKLAESAGDDGEPVKW